MDCNSMEKWESQTKIPQIKIWKLYNKWKIKWTGFLTQKHYFWVIVQSKYVVSQSAKCQDQIAGGMEISKCGRKF